MSGTRRFCLCEFLESLVVVGSNNNNCREILKNQAVIEHRNRINRIVEIINYSTVHMVLNRCQTFYRNSYFQSGIGNGTQERSYEISRKC